MYIVFLCVFCRKYGFVLNGQIFEYYLEVVVIGFRRENKISKLTQSAHVGCQRNRPHQGGPGLLLYVILPLKPLKITRTRKKNTYRAFSADKVDLSILEKKQEKADTHIKGKLLLIMSLIQIAPSSNSIL